MSERQKMPQQPAKKRIKSFSEVVLGYTPEQAVAEAKRCLQCKNPFCVAGCPVEIDIPAFIKLIEEGKFAEAALKIKEKNSLPAICGRVCPQEDQCEKVCILAKKGESCAIGRLERFAADWERGKGKREKGKGEGGRVAVVGSGPAGLTCASDLAKMGYQVTLFESLHAPGGVLIYGIPEFRMPKAIVNAEIDYVKSLGVDLQVNVLVGRTMTIKDLFDQGYKAIFIGTGAGLPRFMGIPGENLDGVYSANEFLTRVNLMKAYLFPQYVTPVKVGKKVVVVGGGNVAMDAARSALRLGAQVTIVYRRSRLEMPAREEEIIHGEEEGIKFMILTNPTRIIGNEKGWVKEMECLRMELGEPDSSGRRRPVPLAGSEFTLAVDTVVMAIGQSPNPLISKTTPDLRTTKWGGIFAEGDTGQTSLLGVFAGGDIVTGAATVIDAMGAGKKAARAIDRFIKKA